MRLGMGWCRSVPPSICQMRLVAAHPRRRVIGEGAAGRDPDIDIAQ